MRPACLFRTLAVALIALHAWALCAEAALQARHRASHENRLGKARIDSVTFELFCDRIGVTRDMDDRVWQAFDKYQERCMHLEELLHDRCLRMDANAILVELKKVAPITDPEVIQRIKTIEQWQELRHQAHEAVETPEYQAINERAKAVGRVIQQAAAQCRSMTFEFLNEIAVMIDAPEESREGALRFVRRSMYVSARSGGERPDFSIPVNVQSLAEVAGLLTLEPPRFRNAADADTFHRLLTVILLTYEVEHDAVLQNIEADLARREAELLIVPNTQVYSERERQESAWWRLRHDVSFRCVQQIHALLAQYVDEEASATLLDVWKRLFCPDLSRYPWPYDLLDWINDQPGISPEVHSLAADLQREYRVEWERLREAAIASGVALYSRRLVGLAVSDESVAHKRRLYEIHRLSRRIVTTLHAVLSPSVQQALASELRTANWKLNYRLLGPYIEPTSMHVIGLDPRDITYLPPLIAIPSRSPVE